MSTTPNCIKCGSAVTYFDGSSFHCTECFHEWTQEEMENAVKEDKVIDSNGNELFDGDDVTVIKDLKVKGSSMVVKEELVHEESGYHKRTLHMCRHVWMDRLFF